MSEQALVRLSDYFGNRSLVELFRRNPLPPSSIFAGPDGVGKRTLAVSLSALTNCESQEENDLCGQCSSCVKVSAGNHPDVTVVDFAWIETFLKSKNKRANPRVIPIDVMRELVREAQFQPFQGPVRVFIVDDAHKLNEAAANSLLKTLEEPSFTTRIVLVTPFPESLLATIRSRCQLFTFGRIRRDEVTRYLEERGEEQAQLKSALSTGSIGAALSLNLEQMLRDRDQLLHLLQGWFENPLFSTVFQAVESSELGRELRNRERALELLSLLQRLAEDLYYLRVGTPERLKNIDQREALVSLAATTQLSWIESFLYYTREAIADIEGYVNPLMCFETLWLKVEQKDAGTGYRQVQG